MSCPTKITQNIINPCKRPVKGLKPKTWVFNMGEFTITRTDNVVSAIVKIGSAVAFTAEGFKDFQKVSSNLNPDETMPNAYNHAWEIQITAATAAEKKNIDKADNFFVVVQTNSGEFLAYGVQNGLWKGDQSKDSNENNGRTTVNFASRDGMEEEYSEYVFTPATDALAYLTALEA